MLKSTVEYCVRFHSVRILLTDILTSIFCISLSTDGHCVELTQPGSMVVKPGQPLTISCKVSYSVSSYGTHWIRQPAVKALEWIGYIGTSGGTIYKDSLKSKFTISRDTSSNTVSLHGSSLQTGDTAVYYCARNTQCSKATAGLYKNPPCLISLLNMHWAHVWIIT